MILIIILLSYYNAFINLRIQKVHLIFSLNSLLDLEIAILIYYLDDQGIVSIILPINYPLTCAHILKTINKAYNLHLHLINLGL